MINYNVTEKHLQPFPRKQIVIVVFQFTRRSIDWFFIYKFIRVFHMTNSTILRIHFWDTFVQFTMYHQYILHDIEVRIDLPIMKWHLTMDTQLVAGNQKLIPSWPCAGMISLQAAFWSGQRRDAFLENAENFLLRSGAKVRTRPIVPGTSTFTQTQVKTEPRDFPFIPKNKWIMNTKWMIFIPPVRLFHEIHSSNWHVTLCELPL